MDTNKIKQFWDWANTMVEVQLNMLGMETRDDRGAISTEIAVVIALIVGGAIVAGGIMATRAEDAAGRIPTGP